MFINSQHFIIFFLTKYIYLIANLYQIFLQDGFGFHIGENVKKPQELRVQIGDDVEIGSNTVIAAQTGIAGSTKIGSNCIIGGQVGIIGHLKIGNNVSIQGQSGIISNIKDDSVIQGSPAINYKDYNKSYVYFKRFP